MPKGDIITLLPQRLVTEKGLSDRAALVARKQAWADAYRDTPHGKPVVLDAGSS